MNSRRPDFANLVHLAALCAFVYLTIPPLVASLINTPTL